MVRASRSISGARLRRCALLIERGAGRVRVSDHGRFDETTAVVQLQDETHEEFARRAVRRLATLTDEGEGPEAVALVLGDDAPEAMAGRRLLMHEALRQRGLQRLSLEATLLAGPTSELLELVDSALAESSQVLVRMRFAQSESCEAQSGVFWSVPPV